MIPTSSFSKRRGPALAGVFATAIVSTLLLCGAGSVPIENFSPQGPMQNDLNAGGHNITNAGLVSASSLTVNGTNISSGAAGPQGPVGPTGATGPQGVAGASGTNGVDGAQGPAGSAGANGTAGAAGPQGPAGASGTNGVNGAQGPAGPTGPSGSTGPAGTTGPQGATGPSGVVTATLPLHYNSGTQTVSTTSLTGLRKASPGSDDVAAVASDLTALLGTTTYDVFGAATTVQASSLQKSSNLGDVASPLAALQNLGDAFAQHIPESASFTASTRGAVYDVTTGSSALTVTLPTAANGFFCEVRKADTGTGSVTVNGSKIGVMGHSEFVSSDGASFFNKFIGGAVDASSNFTYTPAPGANYNLATSGGGAVQIAGVPLGGAGNAANNANGPVVADANNNVPYDARSTNLDNISLCVDGDSISEGYTTATPATNNFGYDLSISSYFYNHLIPISTTTSASTASGATTITVTDASRLAMGQVITASAPGLPAGSIISSISGNTITFGPTSTTATLASGTTIKAVSFYNLAMPNAWTSAGTNAGNNIYDRYKAQVYPHRPWAGSPMPPVFGVAPSGNFTGTAGAGTITGDSNVTLTFTSSADVTNLAVNGTILFGGHLFRIASIPNSTSATVGSINNGPATLAGINPSASTFTYGGDGGVKVILTTLIGTNDAGGSATAATITAGQSAYTTRAMGDGFTEVIMPILPTTAAISGSTRETTNNAVNTSLHSTTVPYNYFAEIDQVVPSPYDTAIYASGLHLTAYGHQVVAQYLNNGLMNGGFPTYAESASSFRAAPYWFDGINNLNVNGPAAFSGTFGLTGVAGSGSGVSATISNTAASGFSSVAMGPGQTGQFTYFGTSYPGTGMVAPGTWLVDDYGGTALGLDSKTGYIELGINRSEKARLSNAGNILVGTTTDPSGSGNVMAANNLISDTAGKGLQVKEGTNAKQGTATLSSGTITVSNTSVTASSRIQLSGGALNSSTGVGVLGVPTITSGTSFVITSYVPGGTTTQTGDLRTVSYEIFEPAP